MCEGCHRWVLGQGQWEESSRVAGRGFTGTIGHSQAGKKEMGFLCTGVRIVLSVDVFHMGYLFYSLLKG